MTVKHGKVVGRFLGMVADGVDLDDDPDLVPLRGTITFTPKETKVLSQDPLNPATIHPLPIQANLDSEGYLVHNFKRGVKLLAPTEDVNPSGWTWTVSFDLSQGNTKILTQSFPIEIPPYVPGDESSAVDLALVAPVPDSSGTPLLRGEPGASVENIALSEGGNALVFTVGSETTEVELPDFGSMIRDVVEDGGVVSEAAHVAVEAEVQSRDLVVGSDPRLPSMEDVQIYPLEEVDLSGRVSRWVDSSGHTWIRLADSVELPGDQLNPSSVEFSKLAEDVKDRLLADPSVGPMLQEMPERSDWYWAVVDVEGSVALGVRKDGTVDAKVNLPAGFVTPDLLSEDVEARLVPDGGALISPDGGQGGYVFSIVDSDGRISAGVTPDGTFRAFKIDLPSESVSEDSLEENLRSVFTTEQHVPEIAGDSPNRKLWLNKTDGSRVLLTDQHNPISAEVIPGGRVVWTSSQGDHYYTSIDGGESYKVLPNRGKVSAFGDSFTANNVYVNRVGAVLDVEAIGKGMSGWASADIALRQGGLKPQLSVAGDAIPASGSVAVTIMSPSSGWRRGHTNGVYVWNGFLAGVAGVLRHTHNDDTWSFTRNADGDPVSCPPGSEFRCIDGDPERGDVQIIFAGRNNPSTTVVPRDIQSMVDHLTPLRKQFVVVSVFNGNAEPQGHSTYNAIVSMNNKLAELYPNNYIDARREFIDHGLERAGITPTAEDLAAIAVDKPPPSLMAAGATEVHPNSTGYTVIGDIIADFINMKGWLKK